MCGHLVIAIKNKDKQGEMKDGINKQNLQCTHENLLAELRISEPTQTRRFVLFIFYSISKVIAFNIPQRW